MTTSRERRAVRTAVRVVTSVAGAPRLGTDALLAIVRFAVQCDAAGVDAVLVGPDIGVDPYVLLGGVAAATSTVVLGCLAAPVGERPPSLLAKQVTSLDVCSGGRAVLGIAASDGAQRLAGVESEAELGDVVEICRAMLRVPGPSYSGVRHAISSAWNEPRHAGGEPMPLVLLVRGPGTPLVLDSQRGRSPITLAARFAEMCAVGPLDVAPFDTGRCLGPPERDRRGLGRMESLLASTRGELDALSLDAGRVRGSVRLLALLAAGRAEAQLAAASAARAAGADAVVADIEVGRLTSGTTDLVSGLACL
ncbi:MAG: LLM class flavin-dependent oxidoreductase [Acidimicrobiales bacterium]